VWYLLNVSVPFRQKDLKISSTLYYGTLRVHLESRINWMLVHGLCMNCWKLNESGIYCFRTLYVGKSLSYLVIDKSGRERERERDRALTSCWIWVRGESDRVSERVYVYTCSHPSVGVYSFSPFLSLTLTFSALKCMPYLCIHNALETRPMYTPYRECVYSQIYNLHFGFDTAIIVNKLHCFSVHEKMCHFIPACWNKSRSRKLVLL
jgi:hypothetical protein